MSYQIKPDEAESCVVLSCEGQVPSGQLAAAGDGAESLLCDHG